MKYYEIQDQDQNEVQDEDQRLTPTVVRAVRSHPRLLPHFERLVPRGSSLWLLGSRPNPETGSWEPPYINSEEPFELLEPDEYDVRWFFRRCDVETAARLAGSNDRSLRSFFAKAALKEGRFDMARAIMPDIADFADLNYEPELSYLVSRCVCIRGENVRYQNMTALLEGIPVESGATLTTSYPPHDIATTPYDTAFERYARYLLTDRRRRPVLFQSSDLLAACAQCGNIPRFRRVVALWSEVYHDNLSPEDSGVIDGVVVSIDAVCDALDLLITEMDVHDLDIETVLACLATFEFPDARVRRFDMTWALETTNHGNYRMNLAYIEKTKCTDMEVLDKTADMASEAGDFQALRRLAKHARENGIAVNLHLDRLHDHIRVLPYLSELSRAMKVSPGFEYLEDVHKALAATEHLVGGLTHQEIDLILNA